MSVIRKPVVEYKHYSVLLWYFGKSPVCICSLLYIKPTLMIQRSTIFTGTKYYTIIVEEWKTNLMSLAILFHFLCAQHVSDINISIIRNLRLCWWITTSVVLFSVRCVLEIWCGWFWVVLVLQAEALQLSCDKRLTHRTFVT
jgi:hypothetical protein